jgi:O-antigen/teichoic acid export membrane protein
MFSKTLDFRKVKALVQKVVLAIRSKLARQIILHTALQVFGFICLFMTSILVSKVGGAKIQGLYNLYKSFVDFFVYAASFGIPTAVTLALNRNDMQISTALKLSKYFPVLIFPLLFIFGLFLFPDDSGARHYSMFQLIAVLSLSLACTLMISQSIARSILITINDGSVFSLVSILHSVLAIILFPAFVAQGFIGFPLGYLILSAVSSIVSFGILFRFVRKIVSPDVKSIKVNSIFQFVKYSSHAYFQTMFVTAVPLLTVTIMQRSGASIEQVGLFGIASLLLQILAALANILSPLTLNFASKTYFTGGGTPPILWSSAVAALIQVLTLLMFPLYTTMIDQLLGLEFNGALYPAYLLAFSVFPVVSVRLCTPIYQGMGKHTLVTVVYGCKLLVMTAVALFFWVVRGRFAADEAALSWLISEYFSYAILVIGLRYSRSYQ